MTRGSWSTGSRVHEPEATSAEGYRLIWYHSTRKAELDALARHKRIERATAALAELRAKLASPRTRYRERAKVAEAVEAILRDGDVEGLRSRSTIEERTTETFRQERRGRPGPTRGTCRAAGHAVRPDLPGRPRPAGRGGAVRRDLPADHQRDDDVGAGPAAGLQAAADDREAVRAAEDGLRGGAGVPEGGEPDPGVALRVLLRAAGGVAAGAGAAAGDGARRGSRACRCTPRAGRAAARRPGG